MCLIYVAWRRHSRYRLVVAANRDEYHARPAAPAHWWDDAPGLLAGRDLTAGGTWLGVDSAGRFAALTNYQGPTPGTGTGPANAPSRGALVSDFLTGDESATRYLRRIVGDGHRYNGFSLLAMDGDSLAFASNRSREAVRLGAGVYGLSNHLLDTPWPKVTEGKVELERLLREPDVHVPDLLALLADRGAAATNALCADNGSDLRRMRWRSSRFILGGDYGTRTSTVVLLDSDGAGVFVERSFDARGRAIGDAAFDLRAGGASPEIGQGAGIARGAGSDRLQTQGGSR